MKVTIGIIFLLLCFSGCTFREFERGTIINSRDGKTYFRIIKDNGKECLPFYLDGNKWPHNLYDHGEVRAGKHTIGCGKEKEIHTFEIPAGVVFSFDNWH